MGMYDVAADTSLEANGVPVNFGSFRVTIARAGGGNKTFAKLAAEIFGQYRRAMALGLMKDEDTRPLTAELYAKSIIKKWEVLREGKWVEGIDSEDGSVLPFKVENVVKVLMDIRLHKVFTAIIQASDEDKMFRAKLEEDDAKN